MAWMYKRGPIWWTKFQHCGVIIRRSVKTNNRQLARERARLLEASIKHGYFAVAAAGTRTLLAQALEEFCLHLRTTKTHKSAQSDIYYLRQLFGPACPAMQINSRKPISAAERQRRLAKANPQDLRPNQGHLRPAFVEDLTTADVSRVLTERMRTRKLAPKTVNRLREVVHRLLGRRT